MYGKDYRYAAQRLNGSIVRRGSYPVEVMDVGHQGEVHARTIVTHKDRMFKLDELDLSSPELGMVNTMRGPVYLARIPKRDDWRQGLRRANVGKLWGQRVEVDSKLIYKCIRGKYPEILSAINDSEMEGLRIAFHRHWALEVVGKRVELYYKWYGKAGSMRLDCKDVRLKNNEAFQFKHLKEALLEVL